MVTKLQFIRIKAELVYIGRRRTTSVNKNDTWVNSNCKYCAASKRGNSNTKNVSLLTQQVWMYVGWSDRMRRMAGSRDSWAERRTPAGAVKNYGSVDVQHASGDWLSAEIRDVTRQQSVRLINGAAAARCVLMQGDEHSASSSSSIAVITCVRVSLVRRNPGVGERSNETASQQAVVVGGWNVTVVFKAKEAEIADCWRRRRRW